MALTATAVFDGPIDSATFCAYFEHLLGARQIVRTPRKIPRHDRDFSRIRNESPAIPRNFSLSGPAEFMRCAASEFDARTAEDARLSPEEERP
jgi:hypothetical protein